MNKKEIAQQFTRQMIGQDPTSLTHAQVLVILKEIQSLYLKALEKTDQHTTNIRTLNTLIELTQKQTREAIKMAELQIQKQIDSTTLLHKTQKSSIWQRYWMAIAMGILSSLLTNLIFLLTMR